MQFKWFNDKGRKKMNFQYSLHTALMKLKEATIAIKTNEQELQESHLTPKYGIVEISRRLNCRFFDACNLSY
jgi:hypothetical protein